MTVCNMSIEWGARAGMIAPDETTFAYLEGRQHAPHGDGVGAGPSTTGASSPSDPGATYDTHVVIDVDRARAAGDLGHEPGHGRAGHRQRPRPGDVRRPRRPRRRRARARVHGAPAGHADRGHPRSTASSSAPAPTRGSRTCAPRPRSSRAARSPSASRRWSCPARAKVKRQAEAEGLDAIFIDAGFEWRAAGCSMCLGMNPDILAPGRALRLDLQPELRGPPGPRRAHAPRQPADGRRRSDRRALRRRPHARLERWPHEAVSRA